MIKIQHGASADMRLSIYPGQRLLKEYLDYRRPAAIGPKCEKTLDSVSCSHRSQLDQGQDALLET